MSLDRLMASLADRYTIEREPRAARPRAAVGAIFGRAQRRAAGGPPSAPPRTDQARVTRGDSR